MKTITTTRSFTFPNGGHSIRKLVRSLNQLGNVTVTPVVEYSDNYYNDIEFYFRVATSEEIEYLKQFNNANLFNAVKLAQILPTYGTRFVVTGEPSHFDIKFHREWRDIQSNPEFYGAL